MAQESNEGDWTCVQTRGRVDPNYPSGLPHIGKLVDLRFYADALSPEEFNAIADEMRMTAVASKDYLPRDLQGKR
jgi:hypothetical protein